MVASNLDGERVAVNISVLIILITSKIIINIKPMQSADLCYASEPLALVCVNTSINAHAQKEIAKMTPILEWLLVLAARVELAKHGF